MPADLNVEDLLNLIQPLNDQDEYKHDMLKQISLSEFPPNWSESWYFNFISKPISCITRISFNPAEKNSHILCLILLNDKPVNAFIDEVVIEGLPDNIGNKRCNYTLIEPHKKWHIEYIDRKYELKFDCFARFKPFDYFEGRYDDMKELAGEYIDLIDTAAQRHYEQACVCKGTFTQKKTGETMEFDILGHRDHSWGVRNWIYIDRWNWISAQFKDRTINIARIEVKGHLLIGGFISTKDGNKRVMDVQVKTETEQDGKTPKSSTFLITDQDDKTFSVISKTRYSIHLPQPTKFGVTEVFEQIADFEYEGIKGEGISEYLISTRK
ncbi:MAG TPA: hypothetical protein VMV49_01610 [Candidatus Deferrimicrobium sp.]|nr:hypothetical protein [Candidatus Deferrimicrobium sp.]